jgi:hypothetical protein
MSDHCAAPKCNSDIFKGPYCHRHWKQVKRHGHLLERTQFEPNDIIDRGEYLEIVLFSRTGKQTGITLVDKNVWSTLGISKITLAPNGYVVFRDKQTGETTLLHRVITKCPKGMFVDHISRNRLDNRTSNLRICTPTENTYNKMCRGIMWDKKGKKWIARITHKGKEHRLGRFEDPQEAIKVRIAAERAILGEFAPRRDV